MSTVHEWNGESCRRYADEMRPMVRFDHRGFAREIAEDLMAREPVDVMDVASGPGFLLCEVAGSVPCRRLVAQDASGWMLEIAREEAGRRGLEVETVASPAQMIPLEDESLDVVTCKQLVHECGDPDAVFDEIRRVLRPGGKAYVIDFDADGSRLMARAIRTVIRVMGGREASAGFWASYERGLRGEDVAGRMRAAGFAKVDYQKAGMNYFIVGTR